MTDPIVSTCSCGHAWSLSEWRTLYLLGGQMIDGLPRLELRNCRDCGSTRGVFFGEDGRYIPSDAEGNPVLDAIPEGTDYYSQSASAEPPPARVGRDDSALSQGGAESARKKAAL